MRALILLLAAIVVALAVALVIRVDRRSAFVQRFGPVFHIGALVADADGGETAVYREKTSGRVMEFKVEQAPLLSPFSAPYLLIRRILKDPRGLVYEGPTSNVAYEHKLTEHGFLPLMAPEVPDALDRVWIIRSIRPERLVLRENPVAGRQDQVYDCWRVDLIDPALPEGSDTVVAWVDARVPVYGLLKWKRNGETWEFVKGAFGARRGS